MIDNTWAGLKTIHSLLIYSRRLAYEYKDKRLIDDLDTAEYLLSLIMETKNRTEQFEGYADENIVAGKNLKMNKQDENKMYCPHCKKSI